MDMKTIVGSVLGGLTLFLCGFTIYLLLMPGVLSFRPAEPNALPFIIVGEILFGYLITWAVGTAGAKNPAGGAKTAAVVGFVVALAGNLIVFGEHGAAPLSEYVIDAVVWAVRWGIAGAVVGWWLGRD